MVLIMLPDRSSHTHVQALEVSSANRTTQVAQLGLDITCMLLGRLDHNGRPVTRVIVDEDLRELGHVRSYLQATSLHACERGGHWVREQVRENRRHGGKACCNHTVHCDPRCLDLEVGAVCGHAVWVEEVCHEADIVGDSAHLGTQTAFGPVHKPQECQEV